MNRAILLSAVVGAVLALSLSRGVSALSMPMPELTDSPVVSCGTSPTVIAPNTAQAVGSICLQNESAVAIYVGGKTVTTSTGLIIPAGAADDPSTLCFDASRTYCIVASGSEDVRVGYGLRQ